MDWRSVTAWCSNPSAWRKGVRGRLWRLRLKTATQAIKPWRVGPQLAKIEEKGPIRPEWRLPKISRYLTSKPGVSGGLDYQPRGAHQKIVWNLRRSRLHRGHPSPIFQVFFCLSPSGRWQCKGLYVKLPKPSLGINSLRDGHQNLSWLLGLVSCAVIFIPKL